MDFEPLQRKIKMLKRGSETWRVSGAVFKTVDRRLSAAMVGSTPTRFRQLYL